LGFFSNALSQDEARGEHRSRPDSSYLKTK
jgi:hypothetical protein